MIDTYELRRRFDDLKYRAGLLPKRTLVLGGVACVLAPITPPPMMTMSAVLGSAMVSSCSSKIHILSEPQLLGILQSQLGGHRILHGDAH